MRPSLSDGDRHTIPSRAGRAFRPRPGRAPALVPLPLPIRMLATLDRENHPPVAGMVYQQMPAGRTGWPRSDRPDGTAPASRSRRSAVPPPATAPLRAGIAFLTEAWRLSPLISRLKFQVTSRTEAEWDIDYDFKQSRINASTAFVNYRFGRYTIGGGDAYLLAPSSTPTATGQQVFNQFRILLGYGQPNKRGFSGAANLGFDANLGVLQYATAQAAYNWDCCGLSVEYRRFALGSVRNENQFRFNFALANVGSFGNLRRQEKLF